MKPELADETAVRDILAAVPHLPEQPDRLAKIAGGVRRARMRSFVGLVLTGVLTLGTASVLGLVWQGRHVSPPSLAGEGADACPADDSSEPDPAIGETPGTLVPSGAARVTLCMTPKPKTNAERSTRTLTQQVGEFESMLNALPDYAAAAAKLRAAHPEAPAGTLFGMHCLTALPKYSISFVFEYPDRQPLAVWLNENCGVVVTKDRTRRWLDSSPLDTFHQLDARVNEASPT